MKNPKLRLKLATFCHLLIAALLYFAGPAMAAAPDLTAGGVPTDGDQWNMGPTGMAGWCYREGISSANARQWQVKSVAIGSPADGIMAVNDVVLGASGTGADPVNFTNDARIAFAQAITDAEAQSPATLKILRWRAGVISTNSLTLETLGAYSATAPYNCPKSAAILEKGLKYMMSANLRDNNWRYSALTLLAGNDPSNTNNAARQARATNEMRELILSPAAIAQFTSPISTARSQKPWHIGPKLIALSEYYLQTGDADVLPSIRAYALCIAYGQSFLGTCGHYFSDPGYWNNPVNGPYNIGYGPINNAALPCYIGLLLAKKCGLTDPDILAGIQRARNFYGAFTHLGCAGYGEHPPYEGNDTNGKSGLQALAFELEGDMTVQTKYYAKSSTAAAIAERDIGHTGSMFAFLYAPLGANVGGPEAIAAYFRETRWMYELARRWDGSFVYNSWSSGEVEVDTLLAKGVLPMATPMLLTYAMPLRQTYLTGKNQDTNNWITAAEMPDVTAAMMHLYVPTNRTTAELLTDITSWSAKLRLYAARELQARPADYATVLPIVRAMATNEANTIQARNGACKVIGLLGDTNSVPLLLSLVTHSNFVVRYGASSALGGINGTALKPYATSLLQAIVANQKPMLPLDPQDPMQLVNGNLCNAVFAPFMALATHDLVGLDRPLLYAAMRACIGNPQAGPRGSVGYIYSKLNQTDIEQLGDVFVTLAYENAWAGMGIITARTPNVNFLQSNGKAEGVPLAIRFARENGSDLYNIADPLNSLKAYAGSSLAVTPDPEAIHFLQTFIANGPKYGTPEAQAALDAIAADTAPKTLGYYKGIEWVIPDDPALNLPRRWTTLRVTAHNNSNPNSIYTWRKVRGAGNVSFTPNGTGAAKNTTVIFDGTPGQYLFEVKLSDSHGLTEVTKTVAVTLRTAGGTLPTNLPPTATNQAFTTTSGAPAQIILNAADPEGYALNYTVITNPVRGYLSGTAPNLVYTPAANYTGADSFTYKVEDSEGLTATATVNLTVNASGPIGVAIYEPFNYSVGNLNGRSGATEIGLTGTWSAGSAITLEVPALTFGTIPTNGLRVKSFSINDVGGSRSISPNALAARGLLNNGATLWFSVILGGYGGYDAAGNLIDFAIANNSFPYGGNIANNGSTNGSGIGFRLQNYEVHAAQYFDASVGGPSLGSWDENITGSILPNSPRLVVGKITWGAPNTTVEIYLPNTDMILPATPSSVLTATNVNQTSFNKLTFSRGSNILLDEIRYGATLQSVLQGTVNMSNDVTAPAPNPMTFAAAPAPAGASAITMTATPALDGLGVEYYFTNTAGGGHSSGWQTNKTYTDNGLTPGVTYSYAVKARDKQPGLNETAASAAASAVIPTLGTVPNVTGLGQSLAQTEITNAALTVGTVTSSGSYSLTVPAGSVLSQSPSGGAAAAYGSAVNLVLSIGQDPTLPVLMPVNIVDNRNGATVELGTPVTYTLTFSKDIDAATLNAGDFTNAGDVPVTIGAINEISPGVVTVVVTPTGTVGGNLRFAVAAGAVIQDTMGNNLNTTAAIVDDTVITVIPVQPKTQTYTGNNTTGVDTWNYVLNWNVNTGPIPSGNDNVLIPAGKKVAADTNAITPAYTGNLTLGGASDGSGGQLQVNNNNSNTNNFKSLGTAGMTTISLGDGSSIRMRNKLGALFPKMPAIALLGNAEIGLGSSSSTSVEPEFNYPITGPYTLSLSSKSDGVATLKSANNFGELRLSTLDGSGYTVYANQVGSLGGNVTVTADYNTGGKGANLIINTNNAMASTATLSLYGNTGTLVTVNASNTIGGLKLNGVKQQPGSYTSNNASWLAGGGTLTVTGPTSAYWNPPGGPAGTWDNTNSLWNPLANLTGTNNVWVPGQLAAFNASGAYTVTLSDTEDIGGLAVTNGVVTLTGGGLSLATEALLNIASGATLTLGTVIAQDSAGLGLNKAGAGTLNLLSENTFTGPTYIGAGVLTIATIDNAGAPSALGQYPTAGPGGLFLAGGTLRYTGGVASVDRGFTFTGNSTIDISTPGSALTLDKVETGGPGTLTVTGGAGSTLALGNIRNVQGNNITLNPVGVSMTVAAVEGYSQYPLGATITLGGSSSNNVVTGNVYTTLYPGSPYWQGAALVKNGKGDWRINGAITAGQFANNSVTINDGTLTLAGNNTYDGNTTINNGTKLVLDFAATDTSKIGGQFFSCGTLELKGGTHVEVVSSTTLNAGPPTYITRNGGTAKLRLNAINRNAGSAIVFASATVADTDRANINGILGGFATLGADWAVSAASAADTPVTALAAYDTWTTSGGSATANYLLTGADTLSGALAANSLKIANTANSQTLNLGANALSITSTNGNGPGGILYAGGSDNRYTITGSGGLLASTTTGELIIHTYAGTLTVNSPVVTTGATAGVLTKTGNGTLILGSTNGFTGATRVTAGKLFMNSVLSNANATLTVDPGATLGGTGTLGRNVTIADGGKLEFNLSTNAANHIPLTRVNGRSFTFSGSSTLTITTSGGAAAGVYTLIAGATSSAISGVAPTNIILPPGCVATASLSGSNLLLNVTSINPLPSYTVTYDGNGNNVGSIPAVSGTSYVSNTVVTIASNTGGMARAGYTFTGWNTLADGSGTAYAPSNTFAISANLALYAQWAANTYTVTFNANGGGTPSPTNKVVSYESSYGTLATVSRTGYTFTGWFTTNSGGTQVTSNSTVAITADQTLYAQWTANTYSVTFSAAGSDTLNPVGKTVTYASTYGTLATTTRNGYSFNGWFTATNGGTLISSSTTVAITTNQTLYAQWTAGTYSVTLDNQGGTGGTTNVTATFGSAMPAATAPTRTNYVFGGYYSATNGGGAQYYTAAMASAQNWNLAATTTLYALWIGPEIAVTRSGNSIADEGYDSVTNTAANVTATLTYSIANLGNADLTFSNAVASATNNCTVVITTQPTSPVTAGSASNLVITVTPTASGTWSFNLSLTNNDADENPFNWTVSGVTSDIGSPVAEMRVTRDAVVVATASTETLTNTAPGISTQLTYVIASLGNTNLTMTTPVTATPVANCSLTVNAQPGSLLVPGSGTNLVVTLTPTVAGAWSAIISISNNVPNKNPYNWTLSGITANAFNITFDKQGGTGGSNSVVATLNLAMPPATAPTRTGYTFGGYYAAPGGSGTQYYTAAMVSAANWNVQADAALYAKWTLNAVTVITDIDPVNIPEGGTQTFQAKLSAQPTANVTVTVSRTAGDSDITVQSGGSLAFTTSNWNTYQTVTLAAANDADAANGTATITCDISDPTYTDKNITAVELDKDTTLTVNNDGNGSTVPAGTFVVQKGVATAITATANAKSVFLNWTVAGGAVTFGDANAASTTVTITAPAAVLAKFATTPNLYWSTNGVLGGGGNWDAATPAWGTAPAGPFNRAWTNANNDVAVFAGNAGRVTNSTSLTNGGLIFNTAGYTLTNTSGSLLAFGVGNNPLTFNNAIAAATISGPVGGSGNVIFSSAASHAVQNPGTLTLNGTSTGGWSGATTINPGITLSLSGLNQSLLNTTNISIAGGYTTVSGASVITAGLTLANTSAAEAALNRVSDTAPIVSYGGFITVNNTASGTTVYAETNGPLDLRSGQLNINQVNNNSTPAQTLTFGSGSLTTVNGAARTTNITSAINFSGASLGTSTKNSILITGQATTATNEILAPWATASTTAGSQNDYAVYNRTASGGATNTLGIQVANIAASALSGWATTYGTTNNYTMSSLAGATISGGSKNINSLKAINTSVGFTANSATITLASHTLAVGDVVTFSGGPVPAGLTAGTPYYVVSVVAGTSFQVSATKGGTAITPTTAGSGGVSATVGIQLSSGNNLTTYGILNASAQGNALNILQDTAAPAGTLSTPSGGGNLYLTTGTGSINIVAPITDNGGAVTVVRNGANGSVTLSGTNTFTGGLVINGGGPGYCVRLGATQNFTGGITLNGGGIGDNGVNSAPAVAVSALNGNAITVNGPAHLMVLDNQTLAASSTITINATGVLKLGHDTAGANGITVPGVVSGSGVLDIDNNNANNKTDIVNLTNANNTFSGNVTYTCGSGVSTLNVNSLGDAGKVIFGLGGTTPTFALHATATAPLTFNTRQFEIAGSSATGKIGNNSAQAFTINTDLIGSGTGARTLTLDASSSGVSAFAGKISDGTLTSLAITKTGTGNWVLSGANSYSGGTTLSASGGILVANHNTALGVGPLTISGGTLSNSVPGITLANRVNLAAATTIGVGVGANLTLAGVITNTFTITKTGSGSLALAGANSYSGATTVSAGKLFINGDQTAATNAMNIATNATFGGTGIVGGNTTISNGALLEFNLSTPAASHDKLDLAAGKTLTFSGGSTLTITSSGGAAIGTYTLLTAPGGIVGTAPANVILPPGWAGTVSISGGTNLVLNVTAGPLTGYAAWSGGAAFNADANGDRVANGLAWMLGAGSINENALKILPSITQSNGDLIVTFTCLKVSGRAGALLTLEHSRDLGFTDPWFAVPVPDTATNISGVDFSVPSVNANTNLVNLRATIPASEAGGTGRLYGRLKVQSP